MKKSFDQMNPRERIAANLAAEKRALAEKYTAGKINHAQRRALYSGSTAHAKAAIAKIVAAEKAAAAAIIAQQKKIAHSKTFMGSIGATGKSMQGFATQMRGLQSVFAGVAIGAYAVSRAIRGIVGAADQKKIGLIKLAAVMGTGAADAEKLRDQLFSYAQETAFSVQQTTELAIKMKALGIEASSIASKMKVFGKLSIGDPAKLKLIAKAYTDVKALGRLMGREVIQFANQGVPILAELATTLNVTTGDLMKMIENGQVSFEMVDKALKSISDRMGNIDTAALQTATGQWDALKDEWREFWADAGGGIGDTFHTMFKGMRIFLDGLASNGSYLKEMIDSILSPGMQSFLMGPVGWANWFKEINNAQWFFEAMAEKSGWNYMTGRESGSDDLEKGARFERISKQRTAAAEKERLARNKQHEQDLKDYEEMMAKRVLASKQMERELEDKALLTGDDSELRIFKATQEVKKRYQEELNSLLSQGLEIEEATAKAAEITARFKKGLAAEEQRRVDDEGKKKAKKMDPLMQIPQEMFRQASVEEYRYIQKLRKDEARETKRQQEHAAKLAADVTNTKSITDAIADIAIEIDPAKPTNTNSNDTVGLQ